MSVRGDRGDRVLYREREVDYDTRSSAGTYLRAERRDAPHTTVKRYVVPREEEVEKVERRTVVGGSDRHSDRERDYTENRVVVRRERTPEPEPLPQSREIRVIEREREPEPLPERREIRVIEREREPEIRRYEYERPPEREIRYERDLDRREDLERYTRTVDYYPRPEPPPPIIIRQEPQQIIFQEAPRAPLVIPAPAPPKEEDFQLIQRSEIRQTERSEVGSRHDEERQIARRPKPKEEEEDYYYERRVREVSRDDRSRHEEDRYSRREREREVSPGDSISQYGRNRRGYESDDSYEYIRKETREEYSDGDSPHHKRHLAEGAIAGIGAAELLRHHRKKTDGEEGSRRSRVGKDVGAAALGAIGAQAVTRARSHYREKSKSRRGSRDRDRSRSRSRSREGRRKHRRDRSRSRSRSKSRVKQLAGLGLGAAAVAAAVGYANRQNKKNQVEDRRSRSRTRRDSVGPADEGDDARNPSHRNKKIAQAGLAGAAVAGLVERARSKSRGARGKSRSKSRVRTGIPIAAAGLGSAAIAGLYERNQAGKKEKEARREERHSRRERRSRSRSQSAPAYHEGSREVPPGAGGDPGLIEYGDTPVGYDSNGVPNYYNRPASQQGYYNHPQDAMVPAAAAGAAYGQHRERERHRSVSDSGSDDGRRRRRHHRRHKSGSRSRSRSRSRGLATAAAAAGAAGLAASEHEKRKQRRKEEKRERKRQQEAEQASYGQDRYAQQPYSPNSPPPAGYVADGQQQQQPYFPPPSGAPFQPPGASYAPEYQGQPGLPQSAQMHPDYGYPPQGGFQPPVPDAYSPPTGAAGYPPQQPREPRRADENVSADTLNVPNNDAPLYDSNGAPFYSEPDQVSGEGVKTPRAQSPSRPSRPPLQQRASSQPPPTKSVKFNLSPSSSGPNSPTQIRHRRERANSAKQSHHHDGYDSEDPPRNRKAHRDDDDSRDRPRRRRRASSDTIREPSSPSSDSTIDLPPRFDKRGRRIPEPDEDPLAARIQELFGGNGSVGRFLQSLGGGGSDDNDDDRDRRRRRRQR